MSAWRKSYSGLAAAITLGAVAAGCGSVGDMGFGGAKTAVLGAKATSNSPDIPDRPKLAMPAPNAPLPVPGQAAPARPQWTATTQQPNQQAAATPAEAGRVRQLVLRHHGRLWLEDAVTHRSHAALPALARNRDGNCCVCFSALQGPPHIRRESRTEGDSHPAPHGSHVPLL